MSLVRSAWYLAAWSTELSATPLQRRICGNEIVLYRDANRAAHALGAVCPHRGANLGLGQVEGDVLQCPFHGWRFGPSGRCVLVPSQPEEHKIPSTASVPAYPVREKQGGIWIWPSADVKPFEEPPHLHALDRTEQVMTNPATLLDADFVNVVENAFDESHLAFLHRSTLGISTPIVPRQVVERTEDRRGVVCRWDMDSPWGSELFAAYDAPSDPIGRLLQRLYGKTLHAERRWSFRMGGVVEFLQPMEHGFMGVVGAATPMDETRTWFSTALSHPIVDSMVPKFAVRWWGERLNHEDRTGTVGLLGRAHQMERPISVQADQGSLEFRRLYLGALENDGTPNPAISEVG